MVEVNIKKRLGDAGKGDFSLDAEFTAGNGITVLLGASGAGKTTVLRLIAGVLTPDGGTIRVNSNLYFDSSQSINLSIQQRRVGYVFQDYVLFPHLTAEQNIGYGIKSGDTRLKSEKIGEMLRLFYIEHLRKRLPREMSGGEQQRVALARALASDPTILLLDEPLSAVDRDIRTRLLDEIEIAQRRSKIPFIYITHNQAEADRLGDRQIILQQGRVLQS